MSLLIFVNPHSGKGLAQRMFSKNLQPLLKDLQIPYELVLTKYAGHAKELIGTSNLSDLRGIVVVSGDGLISEVYNGLYNRPDWDVALMTPVGVVPGGSGNGLARSISHYSKKKYVKPARVCSTIVAKGNPTSMDLVFVETSSGEQLVSFLSIGWGIIADVDIDSERLRYMGELRFSVYGLARITKLKYYKARLYYLPADEKDIPPRKTTKSTRNDNAQLGSNNEVSTNRGNPLDVNNPRKGVRLLPPLSEPVPDNFHCIEGSFLSVYAVCQAFITSDGFFAPEAKLNDGIIWLSVIKKGTSRLQLIKYLSVVNSLEGNQGNLSFVKYIPVKALRLVPETTNTYITVDGEKVSYGPIQAEVGAGTAQVIADCNS